MANLEFLRTFLLAADTGTFRRAATARSVTVSAISQQIKTLEAQLDVPLFERVGRRAQLT
ncbi:MAG: LysR family transcriptional regulator, partial [Myxococcales bacterium]|nr:LysR family transcriptional regulator [Myxococcales bacterium]